MSAKQKKEENIVQLRVDVPVDFRARLKAQSARMGVTMGELIIDLTENPLRDLEKKYLTQSDSERNE